MTAPLTGKKAVVTGGSRGIGRAITLALARSGVQIVACYRRDAAAAETLAQELKEIGADHQVLQADVTVAEDTERLADECRARLGSVDILVHNAAAISHVPFAELSYEEWRRVLDTSLTAAYLTIQRTLPLMSAGSSVIAIGSRAALAGIAMRAHYTAAKAGLVGLARSLCRELGPEGIRVNVVAPGVIETPDLRIPPEVRDRYERMTALGRLGEPEDVAAAVLFLAGDASRYISGETLHVDGGI
ncbi:SDR family NAD(P)-dependent oxidoreductase [Wenjunlia tyrosinilytica]|uniref:Short-chain dehydrogenase n=1 Tax=Wenjunlia tyrosinilytica TaxID=1544741 RepID=A0A917ZXI4_9ACTN|nr:SDR family NAD(P)-dependent oxidoreductase [Wenjunlia tyrosinilytica]GGO97268.1 short-chain dehydrogenase [Wenjunlia tyrosinilytica]